MACKRKERVVQGKVPRLPCLGLSGPVCSASSGLLRLPAVSALLSPPSQRLLSEADKGFFFFFFFFLDLVHIKIYPLKVFFWYIPKLCNHYHYRFPEHFPHPKINFMSISSQSLFHSPPELIYLLSVEICLFWTFSVKGIMGYVATVFGFFHLE